MRNESEHKYLLKDIDEFSASISETDLKLIERMLNYEQLSTVGKDNDIHLLKQDYSFLFGWMFAKDICKNIVDIASRSTYLTNRLKATGLIEIGRAKFKNKQGRITNEGLLVFRLKFEEATAEKLFLLFYLREKIWAVAESNYFHILIWQDERMKLVVSRFKSLISKAQYKHFQKICGGELEIVIGGTSFVHQVVMPPSMVYFSLVSDITIPEEMTLPEIYLSFLLQDYLNCNDDGWRDKLRAAIISFKQKEVV